MPADTAAFPIVVRVRSVLPHRHAPTVPYACILLHHRLDCARLRPGLPDRRAAQRCHRWPLRCVTDLALKDGVSRERLRGEGRGRCHRETASPGGALARDARQQSDTNVGADSERVPMGLGRSRLDKQGNLW